MKEFIKKFIPKGLLKRVRPLYHGTLARLANFYYGRPSRKLVVIGVTGTAGKSTTVQMLARILNDHGKKTGYLTTINFFDGENDHINKHGLSMPGEIKLQQSLAVMVKQGCSYAIIESTSEGLAQNRHVGVEFDVALFTNISPAHIESHGDFEKYRKAKEELFAALETSKQKMMFPKKIFGVNLDDPNAETFVKYKADIKFGITMHKEQEGALKQVFVAEQGQVEQGLEFFVGNTKFRLNLAGKFNVYNALMATACAFQFGVSLEDAARSLRQFGQVAGRMQEIPNSRGIQIFVDYAPEPAAMENALKAVEELPHKRIIHVFGSTGGHRDVAKRFEFGKISARHADAIVVTNDDVYESDAREIAEDIETGIKSVELVNPDYVVILDRRAAIRHALTIAQLGDVVIITGKGSEQFLVLPGNKRIEWDEREVVREELAQVESYKVSSS